MSDQTSEYRSLFLEESAANLQEWENALLGLERSPGDRALIDALFRAVHTVKGSSGFVGCTELQAMLHEIESSLQGVRDGHLPLSANAVQGLLEALDEARRMIDAFGRSEPVAVDSRGLLAKIREPGEEPPRTRVLYRIEVEIAAPPRERYVRSLLVQSRLETVATVITLNPSLEELRLQGKDFRYEVVVETDVGQAALENVLALDQVTVRSLAEMKQESVPAEAASQPGAGSAPGAAAPLRAENMIRVPAAKLDTLLNLVGELVVQNSGFISISGELKAHFGRTRLVAQLDERTEALARVARELQDSVMKVRMLPVATVFNRFTRVVRDLARSRGKQVAMETLGEETEIDKKVIDRIGDPLVHLVRNAIDHGIETVEERRAAGKNPIGTVRLGAFQEGDHICIQIFDDGRGLDRNRIVAKAVSRGLVAADRADGLSTDEALSFVFLPGFSTAESVTDVSGRGVGLDVVKRSVEEMDGSVSLSTQPGKGTTITITLPLTMAIIRAIMVRSGGSLFAIPLSSVNEIVKLDGASYQSLCKEAVVQLRNQVLAVVDLTSLLGFDEDGGAARCIQGGVRPVVVVSHGGRRIGIAVEELLGNTEIVIKSLARHYREVDGFVGASILGNGRIALILDVKSLLDVHMRSERTRTSSREAPSAPPAEEPRPEAEAPASQDTSEARGGEQDLEAFCEIYGASALEASYAMTRLMGREVQVSFPETSLVPIAAIASQLGGDESAVVRMYVGMRGDIAGGCLMVLPVEEAMRLADQLLARKPGTTASLGDEEISGLSEMGNILSAAFINALADRTRLAVAAEVPDTCVDMCLPVIDSVLARFNQPGDSLLLTRVELFAGEGCRAACSLLLFLETASMAAVGAALAGSRTKETGGPR